MTKLERAARIAVKDCLGVKSGESVLVITDAPLRDIGYLLWRTAAKLKTEAMLVEMLPRKFKYEEPPAAIAKMMKAVDVILIPTSNSLSHTKARREACQGGARVVTLPGITVDIMERTLNVDYQKIVDRTKRLADVLTIGRTVRITTPAGTDVTMSIAKAKGYADTGLVHEPGGFSNLPAGEACIAPQEGQTEGIIVVEGSMGTSATMKTPITLIVKDGYAVRIKGGEEAYTLRRLLKRYKRPARNIAELGIGTNHKAKLGGSVLEDEKVLGTVHIALGNNVSLGGTVAVPQHIDGILLKPTLIIDGRKILDKGKLLI